MNTSIKYVLSLLALVVFCLPLQETEAQLFKKWRKNKADTEQFSGERDKYELRVDGIGCPFCAYGLEKKFKEFDHIKNVRIEIEEGVFSFTYPVEEPLSVATVEDQVDAAGYTPVYTTIRRASGEVLEHEVEEEAVVADADADVRDASFEVRGTCGMCMRRIQEAAESVEGVLLAKWNENTHQLDLTYDQNITEPLEVERAIARIGHDTENVAADDVTYRELPDCCRYKRRK